jgi:hypothetical protein
MTWTLILLSASTITIPPVVVSGFASKAACVSVGQQIDTASLNKYQIICIKVK